MYNYFQKPEADNNEPGQEQHTATPFVQYNAQMHFVAHLLAEQKSTLQEFTAHQQKEMNNLRPNLLEFRPEK